MNKLGLFVEFYMGPAYSSGLAQTVQFLKTLFLFPSASLQLKVAQ